MDSFNFDEWIEKYNLLDIKQCFIDYNMMTLNTLNMRHKNYGQLLSDKRVTSRAHLLIYKHINDAILSLQDIEEKNESKQETQKLITLTVNEGKAIENIQENIKYLKQICKELN